MEDATLSAMSAHAKKVQNSQGGTDVNQGMDGVCTPKQSGEQTFYTKQDNARDSRIPNKMHEV